MMPRPRNYILLITILALGLLVTTVMATVIQVNNLTDANRQVELTHQTLAKIAKVDALLTTAESAQRGYLLTGDRTYLAPYAATLAQLDADLLSLRGLTSDNVTQVERFITLNELVSSRLRLLADALSAYDTQGSAAAYALVESNTGKTLMDEVRALLAAMQVEEETLLVARLEASRASVSGAMFFIHGGTVLSIIMLGFVVAVLRNEVRQRRSTETALAEESKLLRALMDSLPDPVYFKDTASRYLRLNHAQARVLGLSDPRLAVGKTYADFQAEAAAAEQAEVEADILRTGRPVIDRVAYVPMPTGTPRWFSSTKLAMTGDDGQVVGVVGVSRDITARMQAQAELTQANERLSASLAAVESQSSRMSLLNELLDLLATCETMPEALGVVSRLAPRLVHTPVGALYLINASNNLAEAVAVWGTAGLSAHETLLQPNDCWALRRGRLHWVRSTAADPLCGHVDPSYQGGYVCVPMAAQGETLGVLHLRQAAGTAPDGHASAEAAYPMAESLGDHVALALANLRLREKLRRQAIRDPLTGLFNRRYLEESLERELVRADRRQASFAVLMMDIDHFKQFNDTFGHAAGDVLLRAFGDYLHKSVRGEDLACRYGGEEFVVVLSEATLDQAHSRAQALLQGAARLAVDHLGQSLGAVTISIGLAAFPHNGRLAADLLSAADAALYRAKAQGRNRVVVA